MWLRIPRELLAYNHAGAGTGDASGNGADAGHGSGDGTGGSGGSSGGGSGQGSGGSGDGGSGNGDGKSGDGAAAKTFSQDDVNRIVQERLDKHKRTTDAEATRRAEDAAAQALKDNQKFEELAKTRETQLTTANGTIATLTADVETLTARVTAADEAIGKILAAQTKDLPPHLLSLLTRMTPAEQLTYLADNADAIKHETTTTIPNHGGAAGSGANNGSGNGAGAGSGTGNVGLAQSWIASKYPSPEKK